MSKERLRTEQLAAAQKVILEGPFSSLHSVKTVTGLNIHYGGGKELRAAAVTVGFPDLAIIETRRHKAPPLSRLSGESVDREEHELDLLIKTIQSLSRQPDIFICHAHGIAHPLRAGLASLLGVVLKRTVIGCAQKLAHGQCDEPPPGVKGAYQYIRDINGDVLGMSLRTRPFCAPVFVSPGHLIDVETAGDIVLACCKRSRLPEPLRLAASKAKELL